MNITLEQAQKALENGLYASIKRNEATTLAIIDTGGNLVALTRMDQATLISIDTAIGKAYTSLALKLDTVNLNPLVQPGQILFGLPTITQQPRPLVPFAGGIQLRVNDEVVGAIGVSGALTSQTDHEIALVAQEALYNEEE